MREPTIVAFVRKSFVDKESRWGLTTTLDLVLDGGEKISYKPFSKSNQITMHIRGRHVLGGQRIRAVYRYDPQERAHWVSRYDVLNNKGETIHSDAAYYG